MPPCVHCVGALHINRLVSLLPVLDMRVEPSMVLFPPKPSEAFSFAGWFRVK